MFEKLRGYSSDGITVPYDVKRCIHAAGCVHGEPGVFDPERKPWIDAIKGASGKIVATFKCRTGALHFERPDGGKSETAPDRNFASVATNAPIYLEGDLTLR